MAIPPNPELFERYPGDVNSGLGVRKQLLAGLVEADLGTNAPRVRYFSTEVHTISSLNLRRFVLYSDLK